jgi:hypothetical protein
MSEKKRYSVTMSFFFWAKNDEQAINYAQKIALKRKKKYDDQCSIDEVRNAHDYKGTEKFKVIYHN